MTPEEIALYIGLAERAYGVFAGLVAQLKAHGVTDEQIASISADYDARIAQAQAAAGGAV